MIKFTTVIIISLILFVIGWVMMGVGIFRSAKTSGGERLNTVLVIVGVVVIAVSIGLIIGEKERQIELRPKVFSSEEYTMKTVVENTDTVYIITKKL